MNDILVVAWGGGVNSTAILAGYRERGILPDCILFADTGGEKPETYTYLEAMQQWAARAGFPEIVTVRNDGLYGTLENECLSKHTMPAIVFGWKTCSEKYKIRPQKKYLKERYKDLSRIVMAIGYDADEERRAGNAQKTEDKFRRSFPLIEWGWGREECKEAIVRAGLSVPQKSACFFCPSSTKPEVRWLAREHPDLAERAILMENNASAAHTAKGLGRHWSWGEIIKADETELRKYPEVTPIPCGCFDGEYEEEP